MGGAVDSPRARLGRSQSLKSRARIGELFKKAKKRSGSYLTVFYSLSPEQEDSGKGKGPKALIAIPKRTGNAVLRNRIRRRLREEFRLWNKRGGLAGEVIVRYNPPGKKAEPPKYDRAFYAGLREELRRLLEYAYNNTVHKDR